MTTLNRQEKLRTLKPAVAFTMTSGLGDALIIGDVVRKFLRECPDAECLMLHRNNRHLALWADEFGDRVRYFNVYSPRYLLGLARHLKFLSNHGVTTFGIQMAPGSLQGHFFYRVLKTFSLIDYLVDFNLINADVITPPQGDYIFDWHLNQLATLLGITFSEQDFRLDLPGCLLPTARGQRTETALRVGVHPWSRRGEQGDFTWPFARWEELISRLQRRYKCDIVVFGRDRGFEKFRRQLGENRLIDVERVIFEPSSDVSGFVNSVCQLDFLVSVNTAAVHVAHALGLPSVVLCGPSLDIWIPKGSNVIALRDPEALFVGADRAMNDPRFGSVEKIHVDDVFEAAERMLQQKVKSYAT